MEPPRSRRHPGPIRCRCQGRRRAARPAGSPPGGRAGKACGQPPRFPCPGGPRPARPRPGSWLHQRSRQPLPAHRCLVLCHAARSRASGQSPVVLPGARAGIRPLRAAQELFVCAEWRGRSRCVTYRCGGRFAHARFFFLSLCRSRARPLGHPPGRRRPGWGCCRGPCRRRPIGPRPETIRQGGLGGPGSSAVAGAFDFGFYAERPLRQPGHQRW